MDMKEKGYGVCVKETPSQQNRTWHGSCIAHL